MELNYEQISPNASRHIYIEHSVDPGSFIPMHWHDALEIIALTEGDLVVETEKRTIRIEAGDIIALSPGVLHSAMNSHGNTAVLVQIPSRFLETLVPEVVERTIFVDPHVENRAKRLMLEEIHGFAVEALRVYEERPMCYELHFEALLLEAVYTLYRDFSSPISGTSILASARNRERLSRIFKYTQEHYAGPIRLGEIAEAMHLQKNYFCRFFRQATGVTYLSYLNDYRLGQLYNELISTEIPIYTLLEKHGFTNYPLFRRLFFERFHITPGDARKEARRARNT